MRYSRRLMSTVRFCSAFQLVVLAGLLGATASKAEDKFGATPPPSLWSVGATVGTLGLGGEVSYLLYDYLVVRMNASYLDISCSAIAGAYGASCDHGYNYTGIFAGGLLDIHPFQSGWRVSTGLRYVDVGYKEVASTGIRLGDNRYQADQVGTATISVRNSNPAAPYIGFGYDSSHFSQDGSGFKLGIDLGALYAGNPDVSITTTQTVPGLDADIERETSKIKSDLRTYYNFYPAAMISGRMSF